MGAKRDRPIIKPVDEGLKVIEIDAGAVEHVIVSHLHFDHLGNYDLFPLARYHLRAITCKIARWPMQPARSMCHGHLRMPFEADDVAAMVRKVFADRVRFHDGTD
jgi:glyoxylase-like metal-dependent hydrolase (beta-lactamase superfamily II)